MTRKSSTILFTSTAILMFLCSLQATSNISEVDNTLKLLKEGDEKIILKNQYKSISLVIGNTGAGKSTFLQWIAGDDNKLIAREIGNETGEFIIEDGNIRIGNSTITSKTTFPELVVDYKTKAAYYDCPGFSDTRSVSHDIAGTYFLKKLTDHAERFKIIMTVGYPSVREGVDRQDIMKLMKHTTEFIKNIEKFQNSIALMVTKVDNNGYYNKKLNKFIFTSDEKIIGNIALFLKHCCKRFTRKIKKSET